MRKWGFLVALIAVLAAGACGGHHHSTSPDPPPEDGPPVEPPPPPQPPTLNVSRILCFGDSLTWGVVSTPVTMSALDAGPSSSYPSKLQALETERYTAQTITVWNAGFPGEVAASAATRQRLKDAVGDNAPDVVLLMEGANDLNKLAPNGSINELVAKTVSALEDMVRDTTAHGIPVFIATLPPQRDDTHNGGAATFVTRFNDAVRTMAAKKGAHLVDLYPQIPIEMVGEDGLHLTDEGYQRMAEVFRDALAAAYEVAPAPTGASSISVQMPPSGPVPVAPLRATYRP